MESTSFKYMMLFPAALFAGMGVVMGLGLVGPNPWFGYRTGRTLGNEALWYSVNANAGWALFAGGILSAVVIRIIFTLNLDVSAKSLLSLLPVIAAAGLTILVGVASGA
ncbi:MAG: hypothetical protein CMJ42_20905 [Phyllobacteriaceae bacterium]|nr:hypothetical protein [Phyllobacteriaceae bacterium]MBA90795.1 hypothetical protein [Phyllobacteriaceae bacterium]